MYINRFFGHQMKKLEEERFREMLWSLPKATAASGRTKPEEKMSRSGAPWACVVLASSATTSAADPPPGCPPGCLPAWLLTWLPACLAVCLPGCLPARLPTWLAACQPGWLPACQPGCPNASAAHCNKNLARKPILNLLISVPPSLENMMLGVSRIICHVENVANRAARAAETFARPSRFVRCLKRLA